MLLTEFDAELHDKVTFEAGEAKGEAIGLTKGEAIGLAKGEAIGLTKGKVESLAELVVNGHIPLDVAVSQLNLSEDDFIQQALMLNISIKR